MSYKLVAIDLDGTLLDEQKKIRPRVKEAIQAAVRAGVVVTLATGRRHLGARAVADELGLEVPLILYCGSLVYDIHSGSALYHKPLPPSFIMEAIAIIRQSGYQPAILQSPLSGERIFLSQNYEDDQFMREYADSGQRQDLIERCSYDELAFVKDALTVVGIGPRAAMSRLLGSLNNGFKCSLFSYPLLSKNLADFHGFDFIQPGVGKGIALAALAEHYGIALSETLAIGDSPNDLDMLKAAGLGVAMGNAAAEVKALAGAIVSTNEEDGVAEALDRYILRK
ncbi:Cof-type HAD-IIB family hydrolase (plasmid) [Candidatus Chlorohelix allophototropha]|uniref:Cof-type HAD-IIB family hydrolase n=1 Tax=Candidatus Chlorohelix allophototropha TaxID=3003348 RepID=A0ABY9BAV4_9CHLR|nr:Cof-type HAD-IIB family hydrolase [Chloroflexota bacterium L227-S17]